MSKNAPDYIATFFLNGTFGMDFSVAGKFYRKINITFRVFGVIPSYLVCVELTRDVLRKNKNFDEKIFFLMKNLKYYEFWKISKILENVDQGLRFFIGKNVFSSKILLFFLKTSLVLKLYAHQV